MYVRLLGTRACGRASGDPLLRCSERFTSSGSRIGGLAELHLDSSALGCRAIQLETCLEGRRILKLNVRVAFGLAGWVSHESDLLHCSTLWVEPSR